ncbi:fimbrial protein [Siccibacter turicensis]|uniref:fimbrial protein n=1 Tax=Siccibacter turicensis TaxID=357233 RepID=UPI0004635466|nr:fimbrial protein [Siccibacter turicensis]
MKTCFRLAQAAVLMLIAKASITPVYAGDCTLTQKPSNMTVPVTVSLPDNITMIPVGSVVYKREATLAQLSGTHGVVSAECRTKISKLLNGKIPTQQKGQDTYATSLPGLGVRVTLIYEKPGSAHKEWVLPFSTQTRELSDKIITSDDVKLRVEAIKTGAITQGGVLNFRIPSLVWLSDNSLVVNLVMMLVSPKAHCMIQMTTPQVELPPVKISELKNNGAKTAQPVGVNLLCMNTHKASLSVEGLHESSSPTVFKNVAPESPAKNVGIEMLFGGTVMKPDVPLELALPDQNSYTLPLSVRYAKSGDALTGGNVKAQITLHINYL